MGATSTNLTLSGPTFSILLINPRSCGHAQSCFLGLFIQARYRVLLEPQMLFGVHPTRRWVVLTRG
jgi:hypothetical protein